MSYRDDWKTEVESHRKLRTLHERLRSEIDHRWHRALPFGDELFDRWEKASYLGFGEGSSIYDSSVVIGDVSVGEDTWIGPFTILDGSAGLVIGRHCNISVGVQIYTHDTVARVLTGGTAEKRQAPVRIGDNTYVGPNTIIALGVHIGSRCVIGAGSFVNIDLPDNTIAFGTPARRVGSVEISAGQVQFEYDKVTD